MGRDTFYTYILELQTTCLSLAIMATQRDQPVKGTDAPRPKAAGDPEEDEEEWDSIELPDPDAEWEQVYKCAADPHAIDYYKDEGLIEKPIEDGWTNVTQVPEEIRRGEQGKRVMSTHDPAGLGDKARKRLARQRNAKAAAAGAKTKAGTDAGSGSGSGTTRYIPDGYVPTPAPAPATTTTTATAATGNSGRMADGWIRAALSHRPPFGAFLDTERRETK
ncbi:uncharacterized protein GGS22DRAFT_44038 [Annulohypoxylon maeteangense]|uniref:uncharacterized protein n=1 Tax=Annulohypoxylon maeteangense TaxID=1927788 RepID=UPI002007F854|nr:uncharacterized protein GGS22DRAFT_44038 [Annulohypoxylon maeteangense]KAI0882432.1 hypothetical protein GGS22DRAFT_44038 [Annulohypoxylon maeteangense]